jgi:hypothetical protein
MKNPKKIFIATAITVIILFILGNWATPAQANNAGIAT